MKLLLWNIEWAPSARIRDYVRETLRAESPDVFCLTESTDFFASEYANVITSTEDYGYANDGDRRKVWLVSRCEWTAIDHGEGSDLPPGRFVSGITEGIRIVGVCVPWFDAHVSTGNTNRKCWEDHIAYLRALGPILARYAEDDIPVCVLGALTNGFRRLLGILPTLSTFTPLSATRTLSILAVRPMSMVNN